MAETTQRSQASESGTGFPFCCGLTPGDTSLSEFDRKVLDAFSLVILSPDAKKGSAIPFQFPPKVVTDAKQAIFKVHQFPAGWEPIKVYYGSEARVLTVEAEWISTGGSEGGAGFNPEKIAEIFREIRQYYYQATIGVGGTKGGKKASYPTVKLQAYEVVPVAAFFRMMAFNVAYGPEMASTGTPNKVLPVYAKTTFLLELVTDNTADDSIKALIGKGDIGRSKKKNSLFKVGPLEPLIKEWF